MLRGRLAGGIAAVSVALLLAGCASTTEAPTDPVAEDDAAVPFLIDENFADPDVLPVDGGYIAFATNVFGVNVPSATSPDLVDWTLTRTDALPKLPAWTSTGKVWAPDVSARADGGYAMFFTSEDRESGRQCIGAATSDAVDGPYVATSDEPLVCPVEEGGAIDASTFVDADGTRYLLWKNDGNCCGQDTWIQIAPLGADGVSLAGPATKLFSQSLPWEGDLVEAPVLVRHGDRYVVFYSANSYGGDEYAMGWASADTLLGPYTKSDEPLLSTASSDGRWRGPGGQDVVATPDGDVLVFHAWDESYAYRGMTSAVLEWDGDVPRVILPD